MFGLAALTQLATAQVRDRRALLVGFPLLLVALVALVVILTVRSWELLVVVTAALGVAVGLTFMGSVTLVDRVSDEEDRGAVLAGFYSAGYLALAVPTVGVAEASEQIGLANSAIVFGVLLAASVAVLYRATLRTPTPPGGGGRPRARCGPRFAPVTAPGRARAAPRLLRPVVVQRGVARDQTGGERMVEDEMREEPAVLVAPRRIPRKPERMFGEEDPEELGREGMVLGVVARRFRRQSERGPDRVGGILVSQLHAPRGALALDKVRLRSVPRRGRRNLGPPAPRRGSR